jgi:putative ABC transport system permease protein
MDAILSDLRHTLRGLVARPTFASVVITTLALVIGAATAVLAVVNATLVGPLPFPHGERLAQLFLMPPGPPDWTARNPQSTGTFLRFRQHVKHAEMVEGVWSRDRVLGGDLEPEVVVAGAVSPGLFSIFGGAPALGRTFSEAEDQSNAKVVVLSHGLWQRRFGGDAAIIGQVVVIDREPHEIIGVMPPDFRTGFVQTTIWTPLNATEAGVASGNTTVQTFARLKAGATVEQLDAEMRPIMTAAIAENPKVLTGWSSLAVSLRDAQFRLQRSSLLALTGGVAALLLIACANLANLMLAQLVSRRSQLALRAALGGGRAALIRLQVFEILALAVTGAVAGIILGRLALPVLLALDPTLSQTLGEVQIDWRVQAVAAGAAVLVLLVAGLVPFLRELRGDLLRGVSEGNRRTVGSPRDRRVRAALVGAECALAVVLLACAAVFFSAFDRTSRVNPGFDPASVLTAQLRLSAAAYPTEAARAELISRVIDRLSAVPGVTSVGATLNRFIPGFFFVTRVTIEGRPSPDGQQHVVQFRRASPGYFETMRIPFLRGRDFAAMDTIEQPWVAVVSRQFADKFWPGEDPIGRRILRGTNPRPLQVIGVVGDVSDVGYTQDPAPTIYVAFSQNNVAITPVSLVLRTNGDPLTLSSAVRAAALEVDPQQPIDSLTTVEQFMADSLGSQRFRSTLLALLSGIGLALAGLGVYGITSRAVAERTTEMGVRLALGATPGSLGRRVVWESLRVVLIGFAAGLALAAVSVSMLIRLVPNLEQAQTWMAAPAVLILAGIATLSAVIPARRALTLSPMVALRSD